MRYLFLLSFFFSTIPTVFSQTNKSTYYLIPQVSLLNGDQTVSGQVGILAGWEKNKWGIGMGTTIDYYIVRTLPVFISSHYYLNPSKRLSVVASLGINQAWALKDQQISDASRGSWNLYQTGFSNGIYSHVGLQYGLTKTKLKGWIIGIGYSIKTIKENFNETIYMPVIGGMPIPESVQRNFNYTFNRIAITIGYQL